MRAALEAERRWAEAKLIASGGKGSAGKVAGVDMDVPMHRLEGRMTACVRAVVRLGGSRAKAAAALGVTTSGLDHWLGLQGPER